MSGRHRLSQLAASFLSSFRRRYYTHTRAHTKLSLSAALRAWRARLASSPARACAVADLFFWLLVPRAAHAERKLATPRGKGYSSIAMQNLQNGVPDRFYDEQLRSDGWHLDEVSDDDELDFDLPPNRSRAPASRCPSICRLFCCFTL